VPTRVLVVAGMPVVSKVGVDVGWAPVCVPSAVGGWEVVGTGVTVGTLNRRVDFSSINPETATGVPLSLIASNIMFRSTRCILPGNRSNE